MEDVGRDLTPRYLLWLSAEAEGLHGPFFRAMSTAVHAFNTATWPKDLGLPSFPFRIWREQNKHAARASLHAVDLVSIGEILEHKSPVNTHAPTPQVPLAQSRGGPLAVAVSLLECAVAESAARAPGYLI